MNRKQGIAEVTEITVDRVAVMRELLAGARPEDERTLGTPLPADPVKVEDTRALIGVLHVAERMTPCDEIGWRAASMHDRDPGDECGCVRCVRVA